MTATTTGGCTYYHPCKVCGGLCKGHNWFGGPDTLKEHMRAKGMLADIRGALDAPVPCPGAAVAEAVAAEREACARVAQARQSHQGNEIADAIRARGQS